VLFRGQPEIGEDTGDYDEDGEPRMRRRKADDEYLIRKALIDARMIDAVISLPLNVFYGAGVPACLLILRRQRPAERREHVLVIYAARHFRELSAKNELRPQDVMRMLVHYHAYGSPAAVGDLIAAHSGRIHRQIDAEEEEEVGRLRAEYQDYEHRLAAIDSELEITEARLHQLKSRGERDAAKTELSKLGKARVKAALKVAERNERIATVQRQAASDRDDVDKVGQELQSLYGSPDQLLKHAQVVPLEEITDNEYNMNVPRYVDTFEPEPRVAVPDALRALASAEREAQTAVRDLSQLLQELGYAG
jgi:type I restriction enzyme M protein